MSSHVDVSLSFLCRTISYTEKTNTYKKQIILSMLSASKLVDKKLCNSIKVKKVRQYFNWNLLANLKSIDLTYF